MTNAELIKALRLCVDDEGDCDGCAYYMQGCMLKMMHDAADALEAAESALNKQIPKKAVGTHYANMRCPSCGKRIPSGQGSSSRRRDNWCNYCGQKIDWGEHNE